MKREQYSNLKCENAFSTQTISTDTTTTGEIIDILGFDSILFAIKSGTITLGTITPALYAGDDATMSDEVAVTTEALGLVGTIAGATFSADDDNDVRTLGYKGSKRYLRLKLTTASSANLVVGAIAIKGNAQVSPAVS